MADLAAGLGLTGPSHPGAIVLAHVAEQSLAATLDAFFVAAHPLADRLHC